MKKKKIETHKIGLVGQAPSRRVVSLMENHIGSQ